jgi:hypothetical protein
MKREELERMVAEVLAGIAPEADFTTVEEGEADYPKLFTKGGLLTYLSAKTGG